MVRRSRNSFVGQGFARRQNASSLTPPTLTLASSGEQAPRDQRENRFHNKKFPPGRSFFTSCDKYILSCQVRGPENYPKSLDTTDALLRGVEGLRSRRSESVVVSGVRTSHICNQPLVGRAKTDNLDVLATSEYRKEWPSIPPTSGPASHVVMLVECFLKRVLSIFPVRLILPARPATAYFPQKCLSDLENAALIFSLNSRTSLDMFRARWPAERSCSEWGVC